MLGNLVPSMLSLHGTVLVGADVDGAAAPEFAAATPNTRVKIARRIRTSSPLTRPTTSRFPRGRELVRSVLRLALERCKLAAGGLDVAPAIKTDRGRDAGALEYIFEGRDPLAR